MTVTVVRADAWRMLSRSRSGPLFMTLGRHRRSEKADAFEFAFENYTALGYGDAVASGG